VSTNPDAVQTWLGTGYGVVAIAIVSGLIAPWLMELIRGRFSKGLETHKLNLRRTELLFEREVLAGSDFITIRDKIRPRFTPGNVESDSCAIIEVAENLEPIEVLLRDFKIKHGIVLDDEIRCKLDESILIAEVGKFDAILKRQRLAESELLVISDKTIDGAAELLSNLLGIEQTLILRVRGT
jgi:hypothetical protein